MPVQSVQSSHGPVDRKGRQVSATGIIARRARISAWNAAYSHPRAAAEENAAALQARDADWLAAGVSISPARHAIQAAAHR